MTTTAASDDLPRLPLRAPDSHKGTYGRVLIVGGSRGMSGAVSLAGMAALRSGAGLVTVATAEEVIPTVAGFDPSYLTLSLPGDAAGRIDPSAIGLLANQPADVVAIGPGLGRSEGLSLLVAGLVENLACPLVIDADGLNLLAEHLDSLRSRQAPAVLTPHPGEFARLARISTRDIQADRSGHAARFAAEYRVIVVLKGHLSIITDGSRTATNHTGNPGMATGGTGDVLTGVLAALLAQGLSPFDAARLAAHVHGLAGDLGAQQVGQVSLIASDLIDWLPKAFRRVT